MAFILCCFVMLRRPPSSTRTYPVCPYTTLVRSELEGAVRQAVAKEDFARIDKEFQAYRAAKARMPSGTYRASRLIYGVSIPQLPAGRSEEHTSELQSLMRSSDAVFYLKKKQIDILVSAVCMSKTKI